MVQDVLGQKSTCKTYGVSTVREENNVRSIDGEGMQGLCLTDYIEHGLARGGGGKEEPREKTLANTSRQNTQG